MEQATLCKKSASMTDEVNPSKLSSWCDFNSYPATFKKGGGIYFMTTNGADVTSVAHGACYSVIAMIFIR